MGCYANDGLLRVYNLKREWSSVASTAATKAQVLLSYIWGQQCGPLGEAEGWIDAVLPLAALFIPHVVWNMNEAHTQIAPT